MIAIYYLLLLNCVCSNESDVNVKSFNSIEIAISHFFDFDPVEFRSADFYEQIGFVFEDIKDIQSVLDFLLQRLSVFGSVTHEVRDGGSTIWRSANMLDQNAVQMSVEKTRSGRWIEVAFYKKYVDSSGGVTYVISFTQSVAGVEIHGSYVIELW